MERNLQGVRGRRLKVYENWPQQGYFAIIFVIGIFYSALEMVTYVLHGHASLVKIYKVLSWITFIWTFVLFEHVYGGGLSVIYLKASRGKERVIRGFHAPRRGAFLLIYIYNELRKGTKANKYALLYRLVSPRGFFRVNVSNLQFAGN